MNTIPAQEIKRRGISILDDMLTKGPVHIIKNNQPQYVVLTEERYQELSAAENEAYLARVKNSLEDIKEGRTREYKNVNDLITAIEEDE